MKNPVFIFALFILAALPAGAQRYLLKDGTVLAADSVKLRDSSLVQEQKVAGGSIERVYPLRDVVGLDWPEPEELTQARELFAADKAREASERSLKVMRQFAPFATLPGTWWSDAAALSARSLAKAGENAEAVRIARDILATSKDVEAQGYAKIVMARTEIASGNLEIANIMLDEIIQGGTNPTIEASAWIIIGDLAFSAKNFEKALDAYLHVPAFYGTQEALMPEVLLKSARAYRGYGDTNRAEKSYLELIDNYPDSEEAKVGRPESGL